MVLFFEDIEVGMESRSDAYSVSREEIIEFAERWDPQPFHLDDAAAAQSIFGTLVASAVHTFAIQIRLVHTLDNPVSMLSALGVANLDFLCPVFPGDRLRLFRRVIAKRLSKSKPDRGIVTFQDTLKNQKNHVVVRCENQLMVGSKPIEKREVNR
jgi:acyl dehydratase